MYDFCYAHTDKNRAYAEHRIADGSAAQCVSADSQCTDVEYHGKHGYRQDVSGAKMRHCWIEVWKKATGLKCGRVDLPYPVGAETEFELFLRTFEEFPNGRSVSVSLREYILVSQKNASRNLFLHPIGRGALTTPIADTEAERADRITERREN